MSEPEKTTAAKDQSSPDPQIEMTPEPLAANAQVERYLKRKAEVNEQDHREFQVYLEEKARQAAPTAPPPPRKKITLSRRNALKVVAGTAVAGEAAALGYSLTSGSASKSAGTGTGYGAQKQGIVREVVEHSRADIRGRSLGNWVALLPTKLGGGTYAHRPQFEPGSRLDLVLELRRLQSDQPSSLRLPERRPVSRLRVRQQDAGRPELADLRHADAVTAETAPPGTNIYRVRFDGTQMQLVENVSETTGLGLGVHVTVNPKDAQSYFVTDGQKDIAACFDRTTSKVKAALQVRLDAQRARAARRLDEGRHAHHQEDLSRSDDRPLRLPRHQGQQDRLGNGADGRAVRRGRLDARRRAAHADRRRRHDLASRGPLGGHCRAPVRRHLHPRSGEELRSGRLPAVQQGFAGPVSGRADRQGHLEGRVRQDPLAGPRDRLFARRQVPRA